MWTPRLDLSRSASGEVSVRVGHELVEITRSSAGVGRRPIRWYCRFVHPLAESELTSIRPGLRRVVG
jgi:hypothetical protein